MERTAKLFAANLKRFRESRGFTQETLSERLGLSSVTISNWENDRRWPEPEVMDALCAVLGIKPADLLIPIGERPSPTPQEALRVLEGVIARELETHRETPARDPRAERIAKLGPSELKALDLFLNGMTSLTQEANQKDSKPPEKGK